MNAPQFEGADKIAGLLLANTSPRYQRLEALETWVEGTQYADRKCDWFDDGDQAVPLWERRPCIVYPAVSLAIQSYVDLLFGEGRFPTFSYEGKTDGEAPAQFAVGDRVTSLVDHMPGMKGMSGTVSIVREGTPPYYGVTFDGELDVHKWLAEDEIEAEDTASAMGTAIKETVQTDAELGEDESKILSQFISKHHELCSFRAYCREGLGAAMGTGTTVGIHGHRNGKPFAELIPSKWGTPTFDVAGAVTSLEIRYPYVEEYRKADGKWAVRVKLYRRVIDEVADTTFLPADANEDGREPASWTPDPRQSVRHNLGFCPVVWYPFMKGCAPVNVIDGKAIHALVTDEILHHDIARSQWHRCALLSEPQMCEIGVPPGYNPTDVGRPAMVPSTEHGGAASPNNPVRGGYILGPSGTARRKGPGYVNQYTDPETKVQILTTPADALEAQRTNASDLRLKVQEALCVVFLDPENIKFAATTSGKALEAIKQKQIDRCGQYRDDLRDRFLRPSVDMQLRIAHRVGKALRAPLINEVLPLLKKFAAEPEAEPEALPAVLEVA